MSCDAPLTLIIQMFSIFRAHPHDDPLEHKNLFTPRFPLEDDDSLKKNLTCRVMVVMMTMIEIEISGIYQS